jgi:hypothetical protein
MASETGKAKPNADVPTKARITRISCVAYAVEESASEANIASPTTFRIVWFGASAVASGRPISQVRHERGGEYSGSMVITAEPWSLSNVITAILCSSQVPDVPTGRLSAGTRLVENHLQHAAARRAQRAHQTADSIAGIGSKGRQRPAQTCQEAVKAGHGACKLCLRLQQHGRRVTPRPRLLTRN